MRYQFTFQNSVKDLFIVSMMMTYRSSFILVVNVVWTLAMATLLGACIGSHQMVMAVLAGIAMIDSADLDLFSVSKGGCENQGRYDAQLYG